MPRCFTFLCFLSVCPFVQGLSVLQDILLTEKHQDISVSTKYGAVFRIFLGILWIRQSLPLWSWPGRGRTGISSPSCAYTACAGLLEENYKFADFKECLWQFVSQFSLILMTQKHTPMPQLKCWNYDDLSYIINSLILPSPSFLFDVWIFFFPFITVFFKFCAWCHILE